MPLSFLFTFFIIFFIFTSTTSYGCLYSHGCMSAMIVVNVELIFNYINADLDDKASKLWMLMSDIHLRFTLKLCVDEYTSGVHHYMVWTQHQRETTQTQWIFIPPSSLFLSSEAATKRRGIKSCMAVCVWMHSSLCILHWNIIGLNPNRNV